jgi:hypothetical protein
MNILQVFEILKDTYHKRCQKASKKDDNQLIFYVKFNLEAQSAGTAARMGA